MERPGHGRAGWPRRRAGLTPARTGGRVSGRAVRVRWRAPNPAGEQGKRNLGGCLARLGQRVAFSWIREKDYEKEKSIFNARVEAFNERNTAYEKEVNYWNKKGATAPQAAGVIHTDFTKGFIRVEVIGYEKFIEAEGELKARELGWIRTEGKEYVIQDGDVCNFLINR